MAGRVRAQLSESLSAFRAVLLNPDLRRIQLALVGSEFGTWFYGIALAVYAYGHGGATAVGLSFLIRTLPSFFGAPFMGALGDRYDRVRVMAGATVGRIAAMAAAAAAVYLDGPPLLTYCLLGLVLLFATAFRPAQAALLPSLTATPEELTAVNVVSSSIVSVAVFAGPALGGVLLAFVSPGTIFAITAGLFVWTLLLVAGIRAVQQEAPPPQRRHIAREAMEGFRTIAADPTLRVLIGLYSVQTLIAGALNVLVVVTALKLLHLGDSGVGYLNSAIGIGGVLGVAFAVVLVGRLRLSIGFVAGLFLWGLPLVLIGAAPHAGVAYVLLGLIGVGDTLVEVAGPTLLQRAVAENVLARVFGALESLHLGTMALGAIIAPGLVGLFGIRWALVATGLVLPIFAVFLWRRLLTIDRAAPVPAEQLTLLQQIPLFAPLPLVTVEQLATSMRPVHAGAGEVVIRQGDSGDRFYAIECGELEVAVDGRQVRTIGPGDHFGEIALLRNVPRTATVTARTEADLYSLERDEFIGAVTGHAPSAEAAEAVVVQRLATARTGLAVD